MLSVETETGAAAELLAFGARFRCDESDAKLAADADAPVISRCRIKVVLRVNHRMLNERFC